MGFSDDTQVVSFGGKCPYPPNHLASPKMPLLIFPLGFSVLLSHHVDSHSLVLSLFDVIPSWP